MRDGRAPNAGARTNYYWRFLRAAFFFRANAAAFDALVAISLRCSGVSFFRRALAPRLPISEK
jgi:hypothetical protein